VPHLEQRVTKAVVGVLDRHAGELERRVEETAARQDTALERLVYACALPGGSNHER
jgi:hypothetical protein